MSETVVTTEAQVDSTDDLDAFSDDFFGRKSQDEKTSETTEAAEQDNDNDESSEDIESQTDDEADEAELKEEIPEKPKRKTVQDRIDEVVRQREDLRRDLEAKLAAQQKELEELKNSTNPPAEVNQASNDPDEPKPDAVDKDGNPIYDLGEFDPQYIRDLTRYTLEQERKRVDAERVEAQRREAAEKEQQTLVTQWNERLVAAVKDYPDLVEKGRNLLDGFNNLPEAYAQYLGTVLMSMEKGPDVLYYLSNHPDEATEIVNSGAQKATLALGRIEARFLQGEQEAAKPKLTKAPPPAPVRARGTNGAFISVAPDTDDQDAFEAEFFKKRR